MSTSERRTVLQKGTGRPVCDKSKRRSSNRRGESEDSTKKRVEEWENIYTRFRVLRKVPGQRICKITTRVNQNRNLNTETEFREGT